jgi:hypothetical protein
VDEPDLGRRDSKMGEGEESALCLLPGGNYFVPAPIHAIESNVKLQHFIADVAALRWCELYGLGVMDELWKNRAVAC